MSDSTQQQLAEAQAEVLRLREHAEQVLTEKKRLQRELAELQGAQEKYDAAAKELMQLKLDVPVHALAAEVALDPKLFKALWEEEHRFALNEDGKPCLQTADGKPIMVKDKSGKESPLAFDAKAIVEYLCPADRKLHTAQTQRFARILRGSGASGGAAEGGAGRTVKPSSEQSKPKAADAPQFGLR